jgi:electron transfer flavoprotein alpha subunit
MQISEIIEVVVGRHVQASDLCRQRHPDRAVDDAKKVITVRTASFAAAGEGGSASVDRERVGARRSRPFDSFVGEHVGSSTVRN